MLSLLHILVDIGLYVIIVFIVTLLVLVVFFLFNLLASQPFEEIAYLLVVDGIGEVLRHALETSPFAKSPIRLMLTDTRRSTHTIGLIDIRGKDGVKIEGITLGEFQSDRGIQVAPWTDISGKVVAH